MRTFIVLCILVAGAGCGRSEPREKAEPPPRPNRITPVNNGGTNNGDVDPNCAGGYDAFRYDPVRKCRFATQRLCGLREQVSVCLVARESAVEDATGDCWHFDTCPPEGFTPTYGNCTSNDTDPFCSGVDIDCAELGSTQCNARSDCRAVRATTTYDEALGCWSSQAEFLGCEAESDCQPAAARVVRLEDGRCVETTKCDVGACEDCEPCPAVDDRPDCDEWVAEFAVVRVTSDVIQERWDLLETVPAEPTCLDLPGMMMAPPKFLGANGVVDQPPNEPQMTVLFPIPGGADDCQIHGGIVTISASGGAQKVGAGFFPDVADCSDLYLMARVRMAREQSMTYSASVEAEDGCGNQIADESVNVAMWTNYDQE